MTSSRVAFTIRTDLEALEVRNGPYIIRSRSCGRAECFLGGFFFFFLVGVMGWWWELGEAESLTQGVLSSSHIASVPLGIDPFHLNDRRSIPYLCNLT